MKFESDAQRLVAEQALLNYRELQKVMKDAPFGKGMAVLEQAVRQKGFEQMRQTLSPVGQRSRGWAKKKGLNSQPCSCGAKAYFKRPLNKCLLTVVGEVEVVRRYIAARSAVRVACLLTGGRDWSMA